MFRGTAGHRAVVQLLWNCHEGSDLTVTALVLLRRAWGVGAGTGQVGGKSGPRLKSV